ncbi:uncharacterized protein LOC124496372 isoform X2 [Dermatophagoides farinae]
MKIDSDNVNEFIAELAPMKELKFWHDFIANLLCGQKTSSSTKGYDDIEFQLNPPPLVLNKKAPDKQKAVRILSPIPPPPPPPATSVASNQKITIQKPTIPPKPKCIQTHQPSNTNASISNKTIIYHYLPPPRVRIKFGRKITTTRTWIPPPPPPPSSSHRVEIEQQQQEEKPPLTRQFNRQLSEIFSLQKPLYSTIFIPKTRNKISSTTTTTTTTTTNQRNKSDIFVVNANNQYHQRFLNQSSYFLPIQNSITCNPHHHWWLYDQNYYSSTIMGGEDDTLTPATATTATVTPTNDPDDEKTLNIKDEIGNSNVSQAIMNGKQIAGDDDDDDKSHCGDDGCNADVDKSDLKSKSKESSFEDATKVEIESQKQKSSESMNNIPSKLQFESKSLSPMTADKPPLQRSLSEPVAEQSTTDTINGHMLQKSPSRPLFTSSSFYDPEQHPTLEEQVKLCREIAKQLVSDKCDNSKNKGRKMFEKRVEKSTQWITENEDSFQNYQPNEDHDYHERTITDGPPNLRLLLDPRHVDDINTVQGVNEHIIITQEAKTRDTCKNIVNDLTSPEVNPTRGKALFTKRQQKSEQWIVDNNNVADAVIDAARDKLFRNVKQQSLYGFGGGIQQPQQQQQRSSPQQYWTSTWQQQQQQWSTQSSPIPTMQQHQHSCYSRLQIPGPVFSPLTLSPISSRPSSSMSLRFRDFNARAKPFCRAY